MSVRHDTKAEDPRQEQASCPTGSAEPHCSAQRSRNMAAIHSKDTKPEILVRQYLWKHGFRYRLNHPRLPGKPDIVLKKYRTCIFVNGCFWHGHDTLPTLMAEVGTPVTPLSTLQSSACCKIPKSNTNFWVSKIRRNQQRDLEVQQKLATMGWHSLTIWECQLKANCREQTLKSLAHTLHHIYLLDRKPAPKPYKFPDTTLPMVAEDEMPLPSSPC